MSGFKCQTCGQSNHSSEIVLRVQGWRIWNGLTLGGVESSVVFCAACCGEGGTNENGEAIGWDAVCGTCNASLAEDEQDREPRGGWTEKDAKDWQDDHECEPDVALIPPVRKPVHA